MRLLLASKSPRRRELLSHIGIPVEIVSAEVDEHLSEAMPVEKVAEYLACRKANAFDSARLADGDVLVTADTVVAHHGNALGKPQDRAEAVAIPHSLSGHTHTVYTGVCLRSNQLQTSFTEATEVHFRQLTDDEIDYYVDNYRPYDKAGAYGIQEWMGMIGIEGISGCYYNVMGLPVARLYDTLKKRFPSIWTAPQSSSSRTALPTLR